MQCTSPLTPFAADDAEGQARLTAFAQALQQAGWTLGQNLRLDYRWGDGKPDTMRKHAANLAELAPDVILANSSAAVSPLLQVNRTVPIVFAAVADPVGAGYVESLAQPGGNARSRNSVPISWGDGPIIPGQERRLEPPAGLGARETKLWRGIVDRLPPTYFGIEHRPLLAAFCRHSTLADDIAARIAQLRQAPMDAEAFKQFVELGRALGNQTSALTAVAVRLRLTHSSRFTRQHAAIDAGASSGPKPWTDWGERARKRDEDDDKPN